MKKRIIFTTGMAITLLFLAACNKTTNTTVTPTGTTAPTEAPVPTTDPTPTLTPHEHTWVMKEKPAGCTEEGRVWEECDCGQSRDISISMPLGHGGLEYVLTKEPTTVTEGAYEERCIVCGEVVKKGSIDKLVPVETIAPSPEPTATTAPTKAPEPTATSTPTPVPTNTPVPTVTPIPTNTPTPEPTVTPVPTEAPAEECKHNKQSISVVDETEKEEVCQVICDICGDIVEVFTVPKKTPTPTATPTPTETPKPTKAPVDEKAALEAEHGKVVDEYMDGWSNSNCTVYADGMIMKVPKDIYGIATGPNTYRPLSDATEVIWFRRWYDAEDNKTHEEMLLRWEDIFEKYDGETNWSNLSFYVYYHYDCKTETLTSRLVNSDGSFNRYSDNVIEGYISFRSASNRSKWLMEERRSVAYLEHIRLGDGDKEGKQIYLSPDEFIYYDKESGIIRLYEY